jgi:hypothetical protein
MDSQKDDSARQTIKCVNNIVDLQLRAVDAHVSHVGYSMEKVENHMYALQNQTNGRTSVNSMEFKNKQNYLDNQCAKARNEYNSYLLSRDNQFNEYDSSQRSYQSFDSYGKWLMIILTILNLVLILIEYKTK